MHWLDYIIEIVQWACDPIIQSIYWTFESKNILSKAQEGENVCSKTMVS